MKSYRRHAFEALPVSFVVVKTEITLDCRNQIVTRSKFKCLLYGDYQLLQSGALVLRENGDVFSGFKVFKRMTARQALLDCYVGLYEHYNEYTNAI